MRHSIVASAASCLLACAAAAHAQRVSYPPEEFAARRTALCKAVGKGQLLMFSATTHSPGIRFRQDNDFFYLTGNEDVNAVLVMDLAKCESFFFLPGQNEAEIRMDGPNWLTANVAKERGFTGIHPLVYLEEFLARRRVPTATLMYLRLSERDEVDASRGDAALHMARRQNTGIGGAPSEDAWRIARFRELYPYYELKDIAPFIDNMRMIKSEREIEALRRAGRIGAEGIKRAIAATAAGKYEYELEAEATYAFIKGGAESAAYTAIVGSGPNVNIWHYDRNDRKMANGDLIVMDYSPTVGYETMDITRTWPVSGTFSEEQLKAYKAVLEAQKAIIAAMKPGATRADTAKIAKAIFDKWGFSDPKAASAGHFVGLAVHDVGDYTVPFAAGMVIAVEPIIDIKEKQLHIRVEDTVLVTNGEPEVLSSGVPKELDEVLALIRK